MVRIMAYKPKPKKSYEQLNTHKKPPAQTICFYEQKLFKMKEIWIFALHEKSNHIDRVVYINTYIYTCTLNTNFVF